MALSFAVAGEHHLCNGKSVAVSQVIELCRRCGFEIPGDAAGCPACARPAPAEPSLAALHVAGLALPTRSVHALPAIEPRREHTPPALGPADAARSAFGYTSLFLFLALLGAGLGWMARMDVLVLAVPAGTTGFLDGFAVVATWASVLGLGVGLLAVATWCARRVVRHRSG